jgi:excinuclease ABC subunit C
MVTPVSSLKDRVRHLPREPGCYLWKDREGRVLYVGKAQDLRARVGSYLTGALEARIQRMVMEAADVDFVATRTVPEALVLEQTLIKRHKPKYNVLLTDDKRYPYIGVTREDYPRVVYTRNLDGGGTFFGPFPDAGSAKRVARMINRTFLLRQCRVLPKRECIYYHIGQCTAPCIDAVTKDEYAAQAADAHAFLDGEGRQIAKDLRARMHAASQEDRFEEAARLRDAAQSIESVMQRQDTGQVAGDDADAVGLASSGARACGVVLFIRGGTLVGKEHYFLSTGDGAPPPETVRAFIEQYYTNALHVPPRVLLPMPIEATEAAGLETVWTNRAGRRVRLHVPARGVKRRWVDLAEKNADLLLEQESLMRERKGTGGLTELQGLLGLAEPPARIEAFDISHHKGEHTVASLVVLVDGRPRKSDYRRFRIRTTAGGDDPGAIGEAVGRRYARLLAEEGADALPDLILVDGGRPQLGAARKALEALGLEDLPTIGLAKRLEEVYRPTRLHPLTLPHTSPALHLLQRVRDEAHRFAVAYQDTLKRKALTHSALDDVHGIGPTLKTRLLKTFGSLQGVREADEDALARVPGVSRPLARRLRQAMQTNPR